MKLLRISLALVLALIIIFAFSTSTFAQTDSPTVDITKGGLHVKGNRLINGIGQAFMLRGAQIQSSFNIVGVDPNSTSTVAEATAHLSTPTFQVMRNQWKMNALRLPVSNWLWQNDPTGYMQRLDSVIQQANDAGLVVILSLHDYPSSGSPYPPTGIYLPHAEAIPFWKAIAVHYKTNPMLLYDVFNEPNMRNYASYTLPGAQPTTGEWNYWLRGGTIGGKTYVGMQRLVSAIRSTGAKQVVVVEGFSGTLYGIKSHLIVDTNVMYEVHFYYHRGDVTPTDWDRNFGLVANSLPVFIGEWALIPNAFHIEHCRNVPPSQATTKVNQFLSYMDAHHINWTAYSFMLNRLILDYTNYNPTTLNVPWTCGDETSTAGMGTLVKRHLIQLATAP